MTRDPAIRPAPRTRRTLRGAERRRAASLATLGLLLLTGAAPLALASRGPAEGRHVFIGEARIDTVDAAETEVRQAAERVFIGSDWRIAPEESSASRVVTQWKAFHHPLARLVLGELEARCIVDLRADGPARTLVRFSAGLASASDIERSPAFGAAQLAYRSAVNGWYQDLRKAIDDDRATAQKPVASPAGAAPALTKR